MSESRFTTATQGRRPRRALAAAATLVLVGVGLSACDATSPSSSSGNDRASATSASHDAPLPVRLRTKLGPDPQSVPLTKAVSISATHGRLRTVQVKSKTGPLAGRLSAGTNTWAATGRLEPGTDYVVHAVAERTDGKRVTRTTRFHTEDLTLDQQTYPSVAPLQGETVGVGMPVIVTFDVPVTDKASIEKHMSVTSVAAAAGQLALAQRHRGALAPEELLEGRHATSASTSTSTACPPEAASTARRAATSTSRSATPTSTR